MGTQLDYWRDPPTLKMTEKLDGLLWQAKLQDGKSVIAVNLLGIEIQPGDLFAGYILGVVGRKVYQADYSLGTTYSDTKETI